MVVLTKEELIALTGKTKPAWQKRELDHLGIPAKARQDGTWIVLRVHVEAMHHEAPKRRPQVRYATA